MKVLLLVTLIAWLVLGPSASTVLKASKKQSCGMQIVEQIGLNSNLSL